MSSILYVEDEAALREDVADELADAGYHVLQASDGVEGLEAILRHKPDLVLCDITMPRMNGHELLVELRTKHPGFSSTPFIFVSALCDHKDMVEGVKLGADDYMTKPIDFDLLQIKVDLALRRMERLTRRKESAQAEQPSNPVANSDITWV